MKQTEYALIVSVRDGWRDGGAGIVALALSFLEFYKQLVFLVTIIP